MERVEVFQLF
jgi:hypothetical protein